MNTSIWVFLILFTLNIVSILIIYFFIKILFKLEKRIIQIEKYVLEDFKNAQVNSESIATGLVKGLQQVKEADEKHLELLEMTRKLQRQPLSIMNQNFGNKGFNSGGDLIPSNLTEEEKEILKMYYDRTNER